MQNFDIKIALGLLAIRQDSKLILTQSPLSTMKSTSREKLRVYLLLVLGLIVQTIDLSSGIDVFLVGGKNYFETDSTTFHIRNNNNNNNHGRSVKLDFRLYGGHDLWVTPTEKVLNVTFGNEFGEINHDELNQPREAEFRFLIDHQSVAKMTVKFHEFGDRNVTEYDFWWVGNEVEIFGKNRLC